LGEAYNFSNENQVTVKDLVAMVCELFGGPITEPIVLGEPLTEIPHQYLSAEKARTNLGWEPRYTLKEGLVETIAWYKDYLADNN
jgi:CDP-glucose 4,6-dehydratase